MKYFEHDTEAYKDDKIMLLRREFGGGAVDAYWTCLERIYCEETELKPNEYPAVSLFLQVSEEQLKEWIDGMVKYGLLVEVEGVGIISPRANGKIDEYQSRCSTNSENGKKGGRPRKTPVQKTPKTEQKPSENPNETDVKPTQKQTKANGGDKKKEKKEEEEKNIPPKPPEDVFDDIADSGDEGDHQRFALFAKDALDAWNEETGQGIAYFDGDTWQGLRRSFDVGRTVDDLRLVIRHMKPKWENDAKMKRFVRPRTLFGDKFEGYLADAKDTKRTEDEFDEYA